MSSGNHKGLPLRLFDLHILVSDITLQQTGLYLNSGNASFKTIMIKIERLDVKRDKNTRIFSSGFTLVEMLLVITIMAIMLGGITPMFKPFLEGTTLKHAAQTLSHILRYTRSLAIERSAITQILFDQDTGIIQISIEADPVNAPGTYEPVRLPIKYPKKYRTDTSIAKIDKRTLSGSQKANEITFQPDGTTSDSFIYMIDKHENTYTVGIVGLTGQVMIWKGMTESFYE